MGWPFVHADLLAPIGAADTTKAHSNDASRLAGRQRLALLREGMSSSPPPGAHRQPDERRPPADAGRQGNPPHPPLAAAWTRGPPAFGLFFQATTELSVSIAIPCRAEPLRPSRAVGCHPTPAACRVSSSNLALCSLAMQLWITSSSSPCSTVSREKLRPSRWSVTRLSLAL